MIGNPEIDAETIILSWRKIAKSLTDMEHELQRVVGFTETLVIPVW
jgi:hypothetical protein